VNLTAISSTNYQNPPPAIQGLGLCQSNTDQMPYLTRSFTGTQNVAKICRSAGLGRFDVVYISRWYATRHGAGPLEYELDFNPSGITDNTNISNDWQGKLRYGLLDVNALTERIDRDWREGIRQRHLAITHLDCCASGMGYIFAKDGKIRQGQGELLNAIRQITGPVWRSNGKFAANVCLPY
jgi:adenylosuccinate synthase